MVTVGMGISSSNRSYLLLDVRSQGLGVVGQLQRAAQEC